MGLRSSPLLHPVSTQRFEPPGRCRAGPSAKLVPPTPFGKRFRFSGRSASSAAGSARSREVADELAFRDRLLARPVERGNSALSRLVSLRSMWPPTRQTPSLSSRRAPRAPPSSRPTGVRRGRLRCADLGIGGPPSSACVTADASAASTAAPVSTARSRNHGRRVAAFLDPLNEVCRTRLSRDQPPSSARMTSSGLTHVTLRSSPLRSGGGRTADRRQRAVRAVRAAACGSRR